MREFLKGLDLDKETIDTIMAEYGKNVTEKEEKILSLKQEISDYKEEIKSLKAKSEENDKISKELDDLKAEVANKEATKTTDLEEKDYIIKALTEMTGKKEEDVDKIVKMAKGLKTDENSIEDAIKEVISMVKPVVEEPTQPTTAPEDTTNPNMPTGQEIQQPSVSVNIDTQDNPFKQGPSFNLTKQGQLVRTNPELAKKLAAEAGVKSVI